MNPITFDNPDLKVKISLAELKRLTKQARSLLELSDSPSDNKHLQFLNTLDHFLGKGRKKLFITSGQLRYLCGLAKVDVDRYVFIDIL